MADSTEHSAQTPEWEEAEAASLAQPEVVAAPRRRAAPKLMAAVTVGSVLTLALPAIGEQVLNGIIGLTDVIIAGHLPGNAQRVAAAGAAVGVMSYLQWFCGIMASALGIGATAIVARSIGAGRIRVANRVAGTALSAAFVVGVATSALLFVFAPQVSRFCGLQDVAEQFATQYLRIMVVTISLQTAAQIGMASLRGAGDTVRPMLIMAMVMVINGIFSSAFTFGWLGLPAWGIRGDAFGTLLAYLTGGLCTLMVLLGGWGGIQLRLRHFRIVPHVLLRIVRIGLPAGAEGLMFWAGQFLIVILVITAHDPNGYMMAAHSAVIRIESFSFLPGFGLGIAAAALVGQYLGARQPHEARRAAYIALWLAVAAMTVLAVPMVIFPGFLLRLMVDSPPVVAVGWWPMLLAGAVQPIFAAGIIFRWSLTGAGETIWPMMAMILGMFVVRLPLVIVICLVFWHWGLTGVWIATVIDLTFRAMLNTGIFVRGKWQYKRV